jgi:spore maturation protein CgeB
VRIGVIGPIGPDYFAENIADALERTGHPVTRLGAAGPDSTSRTVNQVAALARQALPRLDEQAQRHIASAAQRAGCETIINVDSRLMPATVGRLRRAGARVVFWFPDHVGTLGRQLMLLAPYDALFFKEPRVVERLRDLLGIPVHYLPQACNPRWHAPAAEPGTEPYLVIASGQHPARLRLLERLIAKDIPLRLYGSGFPRWIGATTARGVHTGQYVTREEKARVFRSASGVLNTMNIAEIDGVNARLFEAAGCGAAVLTEFRETVPELFDVGAELLTFHDFDELVDQATRLLSEPGLTARLGDAAARRAHRDHTYDLRVAQILDTGS